MASTLRKLGSLVVGAAVATLFVRVVERFSATKATVPSLPKKPPAFVPSKLPLKVQPSPSSPSSSSSPKRKAHVDTTPYITSAENVVVPAWTSIGADQFSVEPLRDATGGLAHLTYRGALAAAAAAGAELPTHDDIVALANAAKASGFELNPVILPGASAELMAEGAKPGDSAMVTLRWAQIHDAAVQAQLDARGWDGTKPVANAGKHWMAGAPPGRAYLMGWRLPKGTFIQSGIASGQGPHDDGHHDYGTTTVFVKRGAVA